ncbi:hypothetical protein CAOG_004858 [Capsaspora owczarzaki ATCC 30864]|uniref:SMC hinge domain-containing protein n=2 Tax=Capsaspora owczarzaki (strain ATCC 30864) TaxID=595528 RepID=A0A0D2UGI3_CAPO3|nr:hypothetical protein CAOG_004858 [Capsaspora owczarzaki ATCC 30864]
MTAEKRQYKEQMAEAEKHQQLLTEKAAVRSQHMLWQLSHISTDIDAAESKLSEAVEEQEALGQRAATAEQELKVKRQAQAKVLKELSLIEHKIKVAETRSADRQPELVKLQEERAHKLNRLAKARNELAEAEEKHRTRESEIRDLERELNQVASAEAQSEVNEASSSSSSGGGKRKGKGGASSSSSSSSSSAAAAESAAAEQLQLEESQLEQYNTLREDVSRVATTVRQQLDTLERAQKTDREALERAQEQLREVDGRRKQVEDQRIALQDRQDKLERALGTHLNDIGSVSADYSKLQHELSAAESRHVEVTAKLEGTQLTLREAKADKRETERDRKMNQALEDMKRHFPGVIGRVFDLSKPTHRRYNIAVTVILGRNMDSIVVDTTKTALECIKYMKEQHIGMMTFLPLDGISVKPTDEQLRALGGSCRLLLDVIQCEPSVRRALQFACGNAVVCDTLQEARETTFGKNQRLKIVTLDGTCIHKSGLITGGLGGIDGRANRWDQQEVEKLKRERDNLTTELTELSRKRRKAADLENLRAQLNGMETRNKYLKSEAQVNREKVLAAEKDLQTLLREADKLRPEIKRKSDAIAERTSELETLRSQLHQKEDAVFADFCKTIGVANIREYEEKQLRVAQERAKRRVEFGNLQSRLRNQLEYERSRDTESGVKHLKTLISDTEKALKVLEDKAEQQKVTVDKDKQELDQLRASHKQTKARADEFDTEIKHFKKLHAAALAEQGNVSKTIAGIEAQLEQLADKRHSLFSTCKLENIEIPFVRGSIDEVMLSGARGRAAAAAAATAAAEDRADSPSGKRTRQADDDDDEEAQATTAGARGSKRGKRARVEDDAAEETAIPMDTSAGSQSQTTRAAIRQEASFELNFAALPRTLRQTPASQYEQTNAEFEEKYKALTVEIERIAAPNMKAVDRLEGVRGRLKDVEGEFLKARESALQISEKFNSVKQKRYELFNAAFTHISNTIDAIYKELTLSKSHPLGGTAYLSLESAEEPYLHGIKYNTMAPMKPFRDMSQLSGGEKTVAAVALLFAMHSFRPSPFFVLDEIDAALDNSNVYQVARFVQQRTKPTAAQASHASHLDSFQCILITHKEAFYNRADCLVGIYMDKQDETSRVMTLDLTQYPEDDGVEDSADA